MSFQPDLDAYFARIGYVGPRQPTLEVLNAILAAHIQTIPFENLDVLLRRPICLEPAAIFQKLVHDRRGGYCFEQNGMLMELLSAMGFQVVPLSARVRWQRPRDFMPPRTHVFLRVEIGRESWLVDVGVGGLSPTAAIRLDDSGRVQSTPHEPRRIVRDEGRLFHQVLIGEQWCDLYEFTLEEMHAIDRELANWYTSSHPQSYFRDRLIVSRSAPNGVRLTLLNEEFSTRTRDGRSDTSKLKSPEELLETLATHFDLYFPAGTRFGI
jgi:N-hydroxyarylamine O-acetyltransferase